MAQEYVYADSQSSNHLFNADGWDFDVTVAQDGRCRDVGPAPEYQLQVGSPGVYYYDVRRSSPRRARSFPRRPGNRSLTTMIDRRVHSLLTRSRPPKRRWGTTSPTTTRLPRSRSTTTSMATLTPPALARPSGSSTTSRPRRSPTSTTHSRIPMSTPQTNPTPRPTPRRQRPRQPSTQRRLRPRRTRTRTAR